MKKALAAFLACLLLFGAGARIQAAGQAVSRDVRVLETGPYGYVRFIEALQPGQKRIVVPRYEVQSWTERFKKPGYQQIMVSMPPRTFQESMQEAGGFLKMASLAVSNFRLFWKGFQDIERALATGLRGGMENLSDPVKLYEFWKAQGIYDKYDKKERAFLNQVVFPAVLVWQHVKMDLGVFGLVGLAAAMLIPGPWWIPILAGGLGIAAAELLTAAKKKAVRFEGGDVQAFGSLKGLYPWAFIGSGVETMAGGVASAVGAGLAVAEAVPPVLLLGAAWAGAAWESYNVAKVANAYGIPEVIEAEMPPPIWEEKSGDVREKGEVWELVYSLVR
jgi:hypothetical protein